jgi:hypothetical protein
MDLTAAHKQQYDADGYTLVRGLIPAAELAPLREILIGFENDYQGWPPRSHFQVLDPNRYRNGVGEPVPIGVQQPAKHSDLFRRIADHPNLQRAMATLLGGAVVRFTDQSLIKWGWLKETQGGKSFYHQDSYYWNLDPKLGCNVWIPMDEVDHNAIALAVMPGTQRGWALLEHEQYYDDPGWFGYGGDTPFQRHRIAAARVDESDEVLVPMAPGDGLFFTNYTWHRSEPNASGVTKCAYAIAYRLAEEA